MEFIVYEAKLALYQTNRTNKTNTFRALFLTRLFQFVVCLVWCLVDMTERPAKMPNEQKLSMDTQTDLQSYELTTFGQSVYALKVTFS